METRIFASPAPILAQLKHARDKRSEFNAPQLRTNLERWKALPIVTQGYPYFLQEWGYQSWNLTAASPITIGVVKTASPTVVARLDKNFFRVRFDRLTPAEKRFLRGMAGLGPGAHRIGDIAAALGVQTMSLGPHRASLIRKGMIYSPAYGELAFTVPLFDSFMMRAMPDLK